VNKFKAYLATLITVTSSSSHATDQDTASSFFLDDTPVVLSATRLKQSLSDAPAAITVIDKDMIKASGAKEIVELFRLVPGMQVGYRRGHLTAATYHGMSDEFAGGMQILVDGQSIYNATFGGIFWADFPLLIEDIERIEVIRGPAASTYGPNAFQGVANIITTHTSQDQGAQANFRAGGGDYYRGNLRYGGRWHDLGYRVSISHNENDGLESILDSQDINMISSRFDYQLSAKDTLQYNFGYSEGRHEIGLNSNLNDPHRYERSKSLTQNLRWEHLFNPDNQVSMHLSHHRHESDDNFISDGKSLSNDQLSERIDIELQHTFSPYKSTRMVWGLGSRLERMRLLLWSGTDDKTNMLYHFFSNIEWKFLDDFSLNLGALLEKNSYTSVDISPKIALNYHWSEQHSFRAMASRASRMPTLGEQNMNISDIVTTIVNVRARSPETLKPEEVITFEAGYHGLFMNQKLTADIKFAHQRFRRLTQIYTADQNGVFNYVTGDVARSLNYEIQLDYKPDQKTLVHMGYSWINIKQNGGFINYGESVPHHSLNILAAYKFPQQWHASLGYYYRSEMQYLRTTRIEQFQRLDLILRKTFNLTENQHLELSLIHQNNLGSKDEFDPGQRLSDRTFFEISYQFD
jgi:iron complex outermembrane receptor protein